MRTKLQVKDFEVMHGMMIEQTSENWSDLNLNIKQLEFARRLILTGKLWDW
ncbi:MAG TPA: hypothetical protein VE843_16765 [Ktedonobacteraceae bacterium]|nr:hypothetical protein [Ktedonobacteraceae bacterium]